MRYHYYMNALFSILTLFIFLGAGFVLAQFRFVRNNSFTAKFSSWVLFGLLFFMGFRIAVNTGVDRLAEIGKLSLFYTLSTVIGTAAVLLVIYSAAARISAGRTATPAGAVASAAETNPSRSADVSLSASAGGEFSTLKSLREPLKLVLIVAAGFLCGWFIHIPGFTGESISGWMLRFLLLSIGIDMVKGGVSLKAALAKPETLYLPLGVIAGSLLGGLLPAAVFNIDTGKSLAVASGFGWYSLSGVLITDLGDPVLGSAAFVSNVLRETAALLTIPVISRSRFPHIGIGIAGATSMDVTLPLIEKSCGADSVPLSIASGAALSLLVPLLVPVFFQL